MLSAYNIIAKKRDGHELSEEEIKWFIAGLTEGRIGNYQMTALLMAIYLNGFNTKETAYLTDAMLYSVRPFILKPTMLSISTQQVELVIRRVLSSPRWPKLVV